MCTCQWELRAPTVVKVRQVERVPRFCVAGLAPIGTDLFFELAGVWIVVARCTVLGNTDKHADVRDRVHRVTVSTGDRLVRARQWEHFFVVRNAEARRREVLSLMTIDAVGTAISELAAVHILMAPLTAVRLPIVARFERVPVAQREG